MLNLLALPASVAHEQALFYRNYAKLNAACDQADGIMLEAG